VRKPAELDHFELVAWERQRDETERDKRDREMGRERERCKVSRV
jgi:hypothetical protein